LGVQAVLEHSLWESFDVDVDLAAAGTAAVRCGIPCLCRRRRCPWLVLVFSRKWSCRTPRCRARSDGLSGKFARRLEGSRDVRDKPAKAS